MTSISFDVYGFEARTRAEALGIREAAINSMARVFFWIAWTLRILRRVSRSSALAIRLLALGSRLEGLFESPDGFLETLLVR